MGVVPTRIQEVLSETTRVRGAGERHRVRGGACDLPGELRFVQYGWRTKIWGGEERVWFLGHIEKF